MRERTPTTQTSVAGSLLLAHPSLRDPNFRRTVVLMTADNKDGSMGVVINRPMGKTLGLLGGDFALGRLAEVPLFRGGPVQTSQLILAAWQSQPHGFQLHLGLEPDKAAAMLDEKDTHVRAYFGYAGWSAGQLKTELKANTWIVTEAPRDLFSHPGDLNLWRDAVRNQGAEWRLLADEPDEPSLN